jgi:DNA-binding HxlR family transcriptional regulator
LDEGADIYRTGEGLAAVTSDVQRRILRALTEGSKQLPELVQVTGRSKPTLSSLHMKELLARGLIEEAAHPTDSRRKVYSLTARRVHDADLATVVEAPRPQMVQVGLAEALDAIAAAPADLPAHAVRAQAARIGAAARPQIALQSRRDLWLRLPTLLEESGIALPLRIDLQHGILDLRTGPALHAPPARVAALLAGFVDCLAGGRAGPVHVTAEATEDGVRLHIA